MADVIVTMKIMPKTPDTVLDSLEDNIKKMITDSVGDTEFKVETEPIAFGLRALKISFVMGEDKGSPDALENEISGIEDVNSVEVVDVRRTIG